MSTSIHQEVNYRHISFSPYFPRRVVSVFQDRTTISESGVRVVLLRSLNLAVERTDLEQDAKLTL